MSYTPTQWQTGDTITAEKLNNMESGIENANEPFEPFVVTLTPTAADMSGTMDKTVGEIYEAWMAGKRIVFRATLGSSALENDCTARYFESGIPFPSFNAYLVDEGNDHIICVSTGVTAEEGADDTMYYTHIYTLTPAAT